MFLNASAYNNGDPSGTFTKPLTWTTTSVTNMNSMFFSASVFNQELIGWNVSKVTDMTNMFYLAIAYNNGNPSGTFTKPLTWTNTLVASTVNMTGMFQNATAFNQSLSSWNVSNVTNMTSMFNTTSAYNNGGVALTWTTDLRALTVNVVSMFQSAIAFNQNLSGWNVSNVPNMNSMFYLASAYNWESANNSFSFTQMSSTHDDYSMIY
jgi:surface protein